MDMMKEPGIIYIGTRKDPDAFIKYEEKGEILTVTSTYTKPELRGQGIAEKLVEQIIIKANLENKYIRPVCSYVVNYFDKHPEFEDIVLE